MRPAIEELSVVEWRDTGRWRVYFPELFRRYGDPNNLFAKWFPAVDVEVGLFEIRSHEFEVGPSSVKFPKSFGVRQIVINFYDDSDYSIVSAIRKWVLRISGKNNNGVVLPLVEAALPIEVVRLNREGESVGREAYEVIVDGSSVFSGKAVSTVEPVQVTMFIVGE